MKSQNTLFSEASQMWDLQTLYTDLGLAKNKPLTPMEKTHLRALLCGSSPTEIAEQLGKSSKGVEVDLSNTLYQYIKSLVGRTEEKIDNWRSICNWLEEAGYKADQSEPETTTAVAYELPAKLIIKKASIVLEKNQLLINVNLQITTSPEGDIQIGQIGDILSTDNGHSDRNGFS